MEHPFWELGGDSLQALQLQALQLQALQLQALQWVSRLRDRLNLDGGIKFFWKDKALKQWQIRSPRS